MGWWGLSWLKGAHRDLVRSYNRLISPQDVRYLRLSAGLSLWPSLGFSSIYLNEILGNPEKGKMLFSGQGKAPATHCTNVSKQKLQNSMSRPCQASIRVEGSAFKLQVLAGNQYTFKKGLLCLILWYLCLLKDRPFAEMHNSSTEGQQQL